jgi:hypothetical protein
MTKSGTVPTTAPVGWVFLERHRHDGYTIRWRRGDTAAYVLSDKKLGDHGMADVLGTIQFYRLVGLIWLRFGCWGSGGCGSCERYRLRPCRGPPWVTVADQTVRNAVALPKLRQRRQSRRGPRDWRAVRGRCHHRPRCSPVRARRGTPPRGAGGPRGRRTALRGCPAAGSRHRCPAADPTPRRAHVRGDVDARLDRRHEGVLDAAQPQRVGPPPRVGRRLSAEHSEVVTESTGTTEEPGPHRPRRTASANSWWLCRSRGCSSA